MKKSALLLLVLLAGALSVNAQIYKGKKNTVSFYSYTPMENISATDSVATVLLNSKTGDVIANVSIKGFVFPNALMQEHFNENYMESDKFPQGSFKGKINETVDYTKDGVYTVSMTGTLTVHGVAKPRTIKDIKLVVKGNTVTVDFKFDILLADHNIKIPEAVGQKIAESINVTVHSELENASGPKK
jgi:polyisoprenoid-binding protein YceI